MASDGGSCALVSPCAFSPKSHQYLALSTQDGRLRLWDILSNTLYQEYVPSAHLSATCTCLTWGPCRTIKDGPQRKKRKSEVIPHSDQLDLLALGTAAGTVLLYSTVKGQLHSKLDGGHDSKVNCVRWHPENNCLYSCSDDCRIVEWDLQTGKADKCAVSCLCLSPDGKMLLSAGQTIKMWDLETKEVYRRFTGHATAVSTLCFISTRPPTHDMEGLYFLSGAAHDRLLSVWQVRSDGKDKNAVLSFTLTDEPIYVDLAMSQSKDESLRNPSPPPLTVRLSPLSSVTKKPLSLSPDLHCKKPLSPSCSVQVASPGSVGEGVPRPVPILAAALTMDKQALLLAYGSGLQPVIERTTLNAGETHVCLVRDIQASLTLRTETTFTKTLNAGETHVCLVRDIQASLTLRTETTFTKVKTPTVKADAKLLVPGLPGHSAPIKSTPVEKKRKPGSDTKEMSIEERLSVIDLSPAEGRKGVHKGGLPLQTDSFAVLLVQGLESSDSNILNKVFQTRKEVLIKKTVARLPIPAVLPLVQELPSLVSHLGVLYHMIESRVKMFHKLSRLHGKLYLLITQIAATDKSQSVAELDQTAKLVYEEDSSEDEVEGSGDEMLAEEEYSDHWEEEEIKEVTERSKKEEGDGEEHSDEEMNIESKLNGDSDLEPDNESEEE
ncbi:UNVERIFIED_CONTAM: hypothetical protein FKN15_052245 [Acipenser sinensis]